MLEGIQHVSAGRAISTTALLTASALLLILLGRVILPTVPRNLAITRVVRIGNVHGNWEKSENLNCPYFSEIATLPPANDSSGTCTFTNTYGRLGNRLMSVSNMILHADQGCCHVSVPEMIQGWNPAAVHFENKKQTCQNRTEVSRICQSRSGVDWFTDKPERKSTCDFEILKKYFAVNRTHALGQMCPTRPFSAFHVRSGDSVVGTYDSVTGTFQPSKVHPGYWLYPTSYYTAAMNKIRKVDGKQRIVVFCENNANPTCDFFAKLADVDADILMRTNQPLIDDLHLMLCAREVALSNGSFKHVFELSERLEVVHSFKIQPPRHACKNDATSTKRSTPGGKTTLLYWVEEPESATYQQAVTTWRNTGFQRSVVNTQRTINFCEVSDVALALDDWGDRPGRK